jgi:adenosylhomocysteine nucleosidase
MQSTSLVTLVTALPSEARPLIEHYRLSVFNERPFRVYAGSNMRLVISGIGCEASACAVGYCSGMRAAEADDIWINVGIAGHHSRAIGSSALGGRIRRHGGRTSSFPGVLFSTNLPVIDIVSYDTPVSDYPLDHLCDMEAAGFMAAASRVAAGDMIQVLKVISDNATNGLEGIDRAAVTALMGAQVAQLDALIKSLRTLCANLPTKPNPLALDALFERWHFTQTQRLQLRRNQVRHQALAPDVLWPNGDLSHCRSAREVLQQLEQHLSAYNVGFAP